jgi:transposase
MKKKRSSKVKRYPADLNDKKREIIKELLPEASPNGRPRAINLRKPINAILYIVRSGCVLRL